MPRVLIIGYLYPFTRSGGSYRTLPLAKYLPEFGWEPTVLTSPLVEKTAVLPFRVIETPYRDALEFWKRLFRLDPNRDVRRQVKERFGITAKKSPIDFFLARGGEILNYPDPHKGWQPFALKAGNELLQKEKMDAIISCHPVISHITASALKARYRIPWMADFADLWSQNHNYGYGPIRRLIDTRLELKTLSRADVLVAVSPPWAETLRRLHKNKKVYAISHGFDPAEMNTPPVDLTAKFTITHTGSLYAGKQEPARLFAALRDLIADGTVDPDKVEVRFYGPEQAWLANEIREYGLSGIARHYGRLPRRAALEKQRESQLLLQLNWEDPEGMVSYQLKLFEYLAAQRPILATGGLGNYMTRELLEKTKAGIHAPTTEDIRHHLKKLYQEYKLKGKLDYKGDIDKINSYSYRETAEKFSEILNHLASATEPSEVKAG